jgi:hypothetical protein
MKQFTKKQIINQILQSRTKLDEGVGGEGEGDGGVYKTKSAEGKPFRKPKLAKEKYVFPFDHTKPPSAFILNYDKIAGEEIFLVPFTPEDAKAWLSENKEWVQQRWTELTGRLDMPDIETNLKFVNIKLKPSGHFAPNPKEIQAMADAGIYYRKGTGENPKPKSTETLTRIDIYGIIRKTIDKTNINDFLKNNAIPIIRMPEQKNDMQTQHIDTYSIINDQTMEFRTHNNEYYNTIEEFIKHIQDLFFGVESDIGIERHTPRKYNQKGKRWDPTRFTVKTPESFKQNPLTPITKQPLRGYSVQEKDYLATMDLFIDGYHRNGQVVWEIKFMTLFGTKLKEEEKIDKVIIDKEFQANGSTAITNTNAPFRDSESLDKFREVLEDLFDQIKTIDTEEELINKMDIDRTKITQKIDQ